MSINVGIMFCLVKFYTDSLIKVLLDLKRKKILLCCCKMSTLRKKQKFFNIKDLFNSLGETSAQFQGFNLISFKLYSIFKKFC